MSNEKIRNSEIKYLPLFMIFFLKPILPKLMGYNAVFSPSRPSGSSRVKWEFVDPYPNSIIDGI
jgi:hypothetical protein